jgi:hypothetical protein
MASGEPPNFPLERGRMIYAQLQEAKAEIQRLRGLLKEIWDDDCMNDMEDNLRRRIQEALNEQTAS